MDLVGFSPLSKPPVCRLMDYGKWKYASGRRSRRPRPTPREELKEIRIRTPRSATTTLRSGPARHARSSSAATGAVPAPLRARELATWTGMTIFGQIKSARGVAKVERDCRREGRTMNDARPGPKKSATPAPTPTTTPTPDADEREDVYSTFPRDLLPRPALDNLQGWPCRSSVWQTCFQARAWPSSQGLKLSADSLIAGPLLRPGFWYNARLSS